MNRQTVKQKLKKWGESIDICRSKIERIQSLKELCEDTKLISGINYEKIISNSTNLNKNFFTSSVENAVIKTIDVYQRSINEIESEIKEVMDMKTNIDRAISKLESDEQKIVYLRYDRGLSWDSIPKIVHKSRMQCFRIHNRVLDKLIDILDENNYI